MKALKAFTGIILGTSLCPYTGQNTQSRIEFQQLNLKKLSIISFFAEKSDEFYSKNHLIQQFFINYQPGYFLSWLDT